MSTNPTPELTLQEQALAQVDAVERALTGLGRYVTVLGHGAPEVEEIRHQLIRLKIRWGKPARPATRPASSRLGFPTYTGD